MADAGRKKVMMIAFRMPPNAGPDVYRSSAFALNLDTCGYSPVVVSCLKKLPGPKDYPYYEDVKDELSIGPVNAVPISPSLLHKPLNDDAEASRLTTVSHRLKDMLKKILSFITVPDIYAWWFLDGFRQAVSRIRRNDISLIFSTSGPVTSHLVAYAVHKKYGIPWVAEFRDLWTLDERYIAPTVLHRRINREIEARILSAADRLVYATPGLKRYMDGAYPESASKSQVLLNGFEERLFRGIDFAKTETPDRMVITCTGAFYSGNTPELFLRAVRELIEEGGIDRRRILINFAGNNDLYPFVRRLGLASCVRIYGYVDIQTCIRTLYRQCDVLLSILNPVVKFDYVIPSKLFSYIRTGKTILCLHPSGDGNEMMKSCKQSVFASVENMDDIKQKVLMLYGLWEKKALPAVSSLQDFSFFSREYRTQELADVFSAVLDEKAGTRRKPI